MLKLLGVEDSEVWGHDLSNDPKVVKLPKVNKLVDASALPTPEEKAKWNAKMDGYSISQYIGTAGNPRPTKFMSINYNGTDSNNAPMVKVSILGGHGNAQSYLFLEDAYIAVSYNGTVTANVYKVYAESVSYGGVAMHYGDIFYVKNTTTKVVDFYILAGQYSYIKMTPAFRVTPVTAGTVTQYTSSTIYSSGTQEWANNAFYLDTKSQQTVEGQKTFQAGVGIGTHWKVTDSSGNLTFQYT